jgi:L-iditol 2-dehydrogenase
MIALILKEYGRFTLEDVPVPLLEPDHVLVKVKACAICGSDVHGMDGSTGRRIPPVIMGHEASGVISRAGSAVKTFKEGDRVTFDSTIYCGECPYCKSGALNLCDNRRVLGVSCADYRLDGAFAEYVAIPGRILYPLPDNITFEQAAMVEPLSIALHAIGRLPSLLNKTAAVFGAGMIGLLVIQLLRLAGCKKIIAVDLVPAKLELARSFGADSVILFDKSTVQAEVAKLAGHQGVDAAFEVVGVQDTLQAAVASVKKGGEVVLVGNLSPYANMALQSVVTRQISLYGSCASSGEYPACLDLIADGRIDVNPIISAVAPLSEGAAWFGRLYKGEAGLMKVILKP